MTAGELGQLWGYAPALLAYTFAFVLIKRLPPNPLSAEPKARPAPPDGLGPAQAGILWALDKSQQNLDGRQLLAAMILWLESRGRLTFGEETYLSGKDKTSSSDLILTQTEEARKTPAPDGTDERILMDIFFKDGRDRVVVNDRFRAPFFEVVQNWVRTFGADHAAKLFHGRLWVLFGILGFGLVTLAGSVALNHESVGPFFFGVQALGIPLFAMMIPAARFRLNSLPPRGLWPWPLAVLIVHFLITWLGPWSFDPASVPMDWEDDGLPWHYIGSPFVGAIASISVLSGVAWLYARRWTEVGAHRIAPLVQYRVHLRDLAQQAESETHQLQRHKIYGWVLGIYSEHWQHEEANELRSTLQHVMRLRHSEFRGIPTFMTID